MSTFKVGDKVRLVDNEHTGMAAGDIGVVERMDEFKVWVVGWVNANTEGYFHYGRLMKVEEDMKPSVKVGDTIRVLKDRANFADVEAGDTFTVARVGTYGRDITTNKVSGRDGGWFLRAENFEVVTPVTKFKVGDVVTPKASTMKPWITPGKSYQVKADHDGAVFFRDDDGDRSFGLCSPKFMEIVTPTNEVPTTPSKDAEVLEWLKARILSFAGDSDDYSLGARMTASILLNEVYGIRATIIPAIPAIPATPARVEFVTRS